MAEATKPVSIDEGKRRLRSPAYPYINLETAIKRAKEFYEKEQRNAANLRIAVKHWGYEEKSSGGTQTAAALISFGLFRDEGTGDKRRLQLTPLALRVLLDTRQESKERMEAIKQAALSPKIHRQLWKRWGANRPSDEQLRHTLILDWEPPFNENSVDGFIKEYKDTIAFAKLAESDRVPEGGEDTGEEKPKAKVGDFVQWESQGVLQFIDPKRVTRFSDDGKFLFVEGSNTGIPISEVTIEEAPVITPRRAAFNPTQREVRRPAGGSANMRQDVFSLAEGEVVLSWPSQLSQASIDDLKDWLKIVERKISRSLAAKDEQAPEAQPAE